MQRASRPLLLAASLAVFALTACRRDSSGAGSQSASASASVAVKPPPAADIKGRAIGVTADDHGFSPSSITVAKGEQVTLVFTRMTDDTCATKVVFPEAKIEKDLPLREGVAIVLPTGEAKTLGFQCGMGMYKSKVLIQ